MTMVVMVTSIVVVVVVVKVLVWAIAAVDMVVVVEVSVMDVRADVVIDTLSGVEIIVVAVALKKFAVSIPFFVDVLSNMVVDTLTDALDTVIMGCVADIGVEVLADANGNVFTSLTTALEFAVPEPLREFSC